MPRGRKSRPPEDRGGAGATLGFERTLWQAADALRGSMDAAEYKHVVLGLIFLKYISDVWVLTNRKPEHRTATASTTARRSRYNVSTLKRRLEVS